MKATAVRIGAAALIAAMLLTGCSSSKKSTGSSSAAGTGTTSGTSTAKSGSPIKVGIFATLQATSANAFVEPWSVDGLKIAAKAINDKGGIDGRQVQIEVCDNGGDPNKDAACARQAVTDKWVAVAGGFDSYAPNQTLPILESASIPYVGFLQVTPIEYESTVAFPVEAGVIGGASGTAVQMVASKCKTPSFIGANDAGGKSTADQVKAVFTKAGLNYKGLVVFPPGTTDVSPIIASTLAQKPDCVMFNGAGADAAKIFSGIRKAGSSAKLFAPPSVLSPDIIKALGATASGIQGASTAPLSNNPSPAMKTMLAAATAYGPKTVVNEFTINAYSAMLVIKQALTGMADPTAKNLLTKLSSTSDADAGPLGTINFTKTRSSKLYPRLFNTNVWYSVIKNGQFQGTTATAQKTDIGTYLP